MIRNLMKTSIFLLGASLLAIPAIAQQKTDAITAKQTKPFASYKDRESYAMGVEMMRNLKRQDFEFNLDMVVKGMKDAAAGGQLALTEDEMLESLNISASEARVRKTSDLLVAGQENKIRKKSSSPATRPKKAS